MKPDEAFNALQRQELMHKFVEIGKVLLTWAILKNVDMVSFVSCRKKWLLVPQYLELQGGCEVDSWSYSFTGRSCCLLRTCFNKQFWAPLWRTGQQSQPCTRWFPGSNLVGAPTFRTTFPLTKRFNNHARFKIVCIKNPLPQINKKTLSAQQYCPLQAVQLLLQTNLDH